MRRLDDTPLDPEITAQLDAIDATLAGDPVDPQYAELAELALLLRDERPVVEPSFAAELDGRVARRFGSSAATAPAATGAPRPGRVRRLLRRDWVGPLAGLCTAGVGLLVAVVVIGSGGGSSNSLSSSSAVPASAPPSASSSAGSAGAGSSASGSAGSRAALAPDARTLKSRPPAATPPPTTSGSAAGAAGATASGAVFAPGPAAPAGSPQPSPNGRKIVQSAQLSLGTPPSHIDDVAQEVFDVAGREHAVVNNSNVTQGVNGSAMFQLSVPSSSLAATMTALSQLRYATVSSRTDATQDVNGQYLSDTRKLGDDRALRTSLLKQLAKATTQSQIDSLTARIHDAEASIRSDEATLAGLNHKIDFSQVTVTINQAALPIASGHTGHSGFTLGRAAHDAGRVLTVAAGVALIVLAALVPFALIGALAWWIASSVRRRRREHALDLA